METKRQRTRVLLRAAIGGASLDEIRPKHHRLELSDGSETSESLANESEMVASLNGSGMHYDHTAVGKVGVSSRGSLPVVHSSPVIRRVTVQEKVSEIPSSVSAPTTVTPAPAVPRPLPRTTPTRKSPRSRSLDTTKLLPPPADTLVLSVLETSPLSSSGASQEEIDGSAVADGSLFSTAKSSPSVLAKSTGGNAEDDTMTRTQPQATIQDTLYIPAPWNGTKSRRLESEPTLSTQRRALPPARVCTSTTDSSPSPRSLVKEAGNKEAEAEEGASLPKPPPRRKSSKNRRRSSRFKKSRNQIYPEKHQVKQVSAPDLVDGAPSLTAVNNNSSIPNRTRGFSPTSTASMPSRPSSFSETSTSVLTPLLTSSLRLDSSASMPGGRWDVGGEAQLESFFPDRYMRLHVVSWNMQEMKELPTSLDDMLLPLSENVAADMYVVGTQESTPYRREWELLIQKTLGPCYVMIQSSAIGVIYLCVFMRRDLIWFCSATVSANFTTRPVNLIKTKGGAGISFSLFGSSFLFISSHLTAGSQRVAERNADMHKIATNLTLCDDVSTGGFSGDVTSRFDYVFWFGDLNYRVEVDRATADKHIAKSNVMSLLLKDQLTREILQGNVFLGFSEQPITFAPSYKFDLNTDIYDTSEKQRVPSWTDRILFKSRSGDGIIGCGYNSCTSIRCSDHRAVCGLFKVRLDASHHLEGVPASVAGYDREIYMRANKLRSMVLAVAKASDEMDETRSSVSSARKGHAERRAAVTSQVCVIL